MSGRSQRKFPLMEAKWMASPGLDSNWVSDEKWEQERLAFREIKPTLLKTHAGQYVAMHERRVVDSGGEKIALALRVYARFGYVPIYFGHVSETASLPVRVPSARRAELDQPR